jgi:hypothetical protein
VVNIELENAAPILYLTAMLQWERTAPPDGHHGVLSDRPAHNTQISRMAYVLELVPDGNAEDAFQPLATHTRRNDGHSYISKDASWMSNPYHLMHGWYLEGRTSLEQKKDILQKLTRLGLSHTLAGSFEGPLEGR